VARPDGRRPDQLRPVTITRGWQETAEGSALVEFGRTRVLCAASVASEVPRWRRGSGAGWVTAEYAMLPRATTTRTDRESVRGRIGGRTHEISRLIGRSLRACVDLGALAETTIQVDCDVLLADGGTRTAAITGAYVALADACAWVDRMAALVASVSAVSVGVVDAEPRLDLCYDEDVNAATDMNVVLTGAGEFVEVQGTAERRPFGRAELDALLDLARAGCAELAKVQQAALAAPLPPAAAASSTAL
jgi:ribonuclease PH